MNNILDTDHTFDSELTLLLQNIFLNYGEDFRHYSFASIKRRITHALIQFQCKVIAELEERIMNDHHSFMQLMQYLTISVSDMFRDPAYFLSIRENIVPVLKTYPSLKIWIAGCGAGEEAYSMAILLKEEGLLDRSIIYATDINPLMLERAQQGVFRMDNVRQYTENYQKAGGKASFSDYYTAAYDLIIFDKSLISSITFANHNLATDSTFSEMQLISCRNVMIYFNQDLQNRVINLLHNSLCHRGFLGLGNRETLRFSSFTNEFDVFDKGMRLYRKKGFNNLSAYHFMNNEDFSYVSS